MNSLPGQGQLPPINEILLREYIRERHIRSIRIERHSPTRWRLVASTLTVGDRALTSARGHVRLWASLDTLAAFLTDIGVPASGFRIDL